MESLETIRNRCDFLLASAIEKGEEINIKRLMASKEFLKDDNCFVGANKLDAIYVLVRLGYTFDDANEIYDYFNKVNTFIGKLEYINIDGKSVYYDAILKPSVEEYYRFSDGLIFKCDDNDNFYYLVDGKWVYNAEIQKKFYDSGYGYDRLRCVIDEKGSLRR